MTRRQDLYTRAQAAKYLGVSIGWLAKHLDDGPTVTRLGGKVAYLLADLDGFVNSQRGKKGARRSAAAAPAPSKGDATRAVQAYHEGTGVPPATRVMGTAVLHQLLASSRDVPVSKPRTGEVTAGKQQVAWDKPIGKRLNREVLGRTPPPLPHQSKTPPLPPVHRDKAPTAPPTLPHIRAQRRTK